MCLAQGPQRRSQELKIDSLSGDSSQGSILRDPDMTSLENESTFSVTGTQDDSLSGDSSQGVTLRDHDMTSLETNQLPFQNQFILSMKMKKNHYQQIQLNLLKKIQYTIYDPKMRGIMAVPELIRVSAEMKHLWNVYP